MPSSSSEIILWQALLITSISFGVGLLGGFVGLALGTMRLPTLLLLGIAPPVAGGTNILVSSLACLTGAIRHLREGRVSARIVVVMGVPAVIGAFIGGFTSNYVPESLLLAAAGILVFWQGVEFLVKIRFKPPTKSDSGTGDGINASEMVGLFTRNRLLAEGFIGLIVGLLGGAVGLILGTIRLPALIRILKIEPRIAAGTNLFIGFFLGAVGWIGHVVQGQVDYFLLILMAPAAMVGSYYGAKLTGRVKIDRLILAMGLIMLAAGLLLLTQAFTRFAD